VALFNNVSGDDLKRQATAIANEVERIMAKAAYFAESLNQYDEATLTELGLDANYQANVGSMRTDLVNLRAWYASNCAFVKRFAQLVVF
jgi:hypothetical protein